ncbi:MAG: aminotransferase class V-fold PLP-dependent enzyme [Bacteroidota bacterium]|nr:aminotransferase class V-fold PLP-dependent enzyme [Bacteroidota bacterium]
MKSQEHLFSLRKGIHYLNCAYKAPLLKSAEAAAIRALIKERNPSDISPMDFFTWVDEVRQRFAEIVNCDPSQAVVIPSTSYGLSSVLNNIAGKTGQHVVTVENEFPSDYFSIKKWCDNNNAQLKIITFKKDLEFNGEYLNHEIIHNINEKTAVVILSSVHWMNGLKFDLEKIGERCKSAGAKFVVDGTQSVGAMHIDVKKFHIDALICAGYKWLLGPYSLGLAYMSSQFNQGVPLEESWMNRVNSHKFGNLTEYEMEYTPGAGRYNVGETSNFILMPMLNEALKQINNWSVPEIESYCKDLIQPLITYLKTLGIQFENEKYFSNHLFALKFPPGINIYTLKENLDKANVYVSFRGHHLRLSVNVFNTKSDIEKLIEVIEKTKELK